MKMFLKASIISVLLTTPVFAADTASSFITPYVTRNEYNQQIAKLATPEQVKQLIQSMAAPVGTYADNLTATGSTISDALALTAQVNSVTTVPSGTGVILPAASTGIISIKIYNRGANTLNIYPSSTSDQIENYGAGVAFPLTAPSAVTMTRSSATEWRISP